ncbi:alpha/beta hydrolase [Actinoplanes philippinensis]|uniref:Acetyl esterase n=1 Tax=Actinoplanes philippinensis TaxID=35752 RepID=A0A1I2G0X4_9ACTN|nr:alpha/beta hydrolase [Actinoplanes philippinensis]GIE76477.1 alpha/beta hydrolase [Actinoplanes philippinensis]SFF10779.1 acetyl esterase [Actinoplanes philippinensis]
MIARAVMRGVFALPRPLKRRLAGPPVTSGPAPLALDAQLLLALTRRGGQTLVVDDSATASRAALRTGATALRGRRLPVTTRDLTIPGDHPVAARLCTPAVEAVPGALLLFLHGGGWVIGDLDVYDYPSRFLAHHAQVRVLTVDYRLAPEHPFPAALDDARAAYDHAVRTGPSWGVDPGRIAVGGDSAGATLAAALCNDPAVTAAFQLLLYPATDLATVSASRRELSDDFMLTDRDITFFYDAYTGTTDRTDPRLSPLYQRLSPTLPPTYLATAGYDPLRDEGVAYARALAGAGVAVEHRAVDDMIHGFLVFAGISAEFRQATLHAAHALRAGLRA